MFESFICLSLKINEYHIHDFLIFNKLVQIWRKYLWKWRCICFRDIILKYLVIAWLIFTIFWCVLLGIIHTFIWRCYPTKKRYAMDVVHIIGLLASAILIWKYWALHFFNFLWNIHTHLHFWFPTRDIKLCEA